jgi:hypothetical protein
MNLSKDLLSLESSKEFWKIMMVLYNTNEHLCVCVCVCVCVGDYIGKGNNIDELIKGLNFIGEF